MLYKTRFLPFSCILLMAGISFGNLVVAQGVIVPSDSSVVHPAGASLIAHQDNDVIGSGYFTTSQIPATSYGAAGTYTVSIDKKCPAGSVPMASVYVENSGNFTPLVYQYKGKTYSVGNCAAGRICLAATVDPSTYKLNLYGLASQSDIGGHSTDGDFNASVYIKQSKSFQTLYMLPILRENACDWAADHQVDRFINVGYKIYCKIANAATQESGEVNSRTQACDNTNEYEGGYL